ncbi:MAG: hypothetical protein AB7K52_11475 [Phycisphaerales bacterium]
MPTMPTPTPEQTSTEPGQGSVLRPEDLIDQRAGARGVSAGGRAIFAGAGASLRSAWAQPGVRRLAWVLAAILAVGLPMWAYFEMRARPAPDYAHDDIGDVLDYTLLSADFNNLPIDQRMALIKDLVSRLKSMSAGDSELMAAFAAGITGEAREQMRTNAERLAVDLWDSYSDKYGDVPTEQRTEFLDNAFLEFTKLMEDVAGVENDKTDNERLADARKQAKRDAARARSELGPIPEQAGRLVKALHERGEKVTTPVQRARITRFTRDMVRHLRDQELDTAKPRGSSGGGTPAGPGSQKQGKPGDNAPPTSPGDDKQPPEDDKKPADEKPEDEQKKEKEKTPQDEKKPEEKTPSPPGGG